MESNEQNKQNENRLIDREHRLTAVRAKEALWGCRKRGREGEKEERK